jgi:hypothetical protein
MHSNRQVLTVFLASPGDLSEERVAAQEIVANINGILARARLGWQIDLQKWEDTTPGFGRPQQIINEMVDSCGLFIGILWERWGQPTGSATFTSGFEEEFERAKARKISSGDPEIWLVFKTIDPQKTGDPGPQLARVLQFRKEQIDLKQFLFHDVVDLDDWKKRLNNWLMEYVLKIAVASTKTPSDAESVPSVDRKGSSDTLEDPSSKYIPTDLQRLPEQLSQVFNSGNLEFLKQDAGLLKDFDVVRLYLLSFAWLSRRKTAETLSVHQMNALYQFRAELKLTDDETDQLFRALVEQSDSLIPGWYWFRHFSVDQLRTSLLDLANVDPSASVRLGAMRLLTRSGIVITPDDYFQLPLTDDSFMVRQAAYAYLGEHAGLDSMSFIEMLQNWEKDKSGTNIEDVKLKIVARFEPARAFSNAVSSPTRYLSDDEVNIISGCVKFADVESLMKAVNEPSRVTVREMALRELVDRDSLPKEFARSLLEDPSRVIRAMALESLARLGELPPIEEVQKLLAKEPDLGFSGLLGAMKPAPENVMSEEDIIATNYNSRTVGEVLKDINWWGPGRPEAYRAMALFHFDEFSARIRQDLKDNFEPLRLASLEVLRTEWQRDFPEQPIENYLDKIGEYDDFIRSRFIEAALAGIARNGTPTDVEYARAFLASDKYYLRDAAVAVVCRLGDSSDIPELLRISRESWGTMRLKTAEAALRFSTAPVSLALELKNDSDSAVSRMAFERLLQDESSPVRTLFGELLNSDNDANRMRAVEYSKKHLNDDLKDLLLQCIAQDTYYYNVITWLDRLLYSPIPLRKSYEGELEHKVKTQ